MRLLAALALLLLVLAGCTADTGTSGTGAPRAEVDGAGRIDRAAVAANLGTPIVMDHDHNDAALHTGAHNLELVAWSSLGVTLGDNGFANFVLHRTPANRTLAFVAVDGDAQGGFTIADVTDPAHIQVLGDYRTSGSGFQEVRVTPDGRHALLNVQRLPSAGAPSCSVCIQVVSVADPAHPALESVLPIEVQGTHNLDVAQYPDGLYVFYVGQPADANNSPVGNRLGVAKLVDSPAGAVLLPVGTFAHPALLDDGRSFPHDVLVQAHPDGRRIAYVSHWDGGVATFDASNPSAVTPLGVNTETAPSDALAIHWTTQEPAARRDGRTIVWSAPEIGNLAKGTGAIRAYDGSDPANLRQVGAWSLPGDLSIEGRFLLSPHTIAPDMATGLAAVAHYHAGVWVLDISDPAHPAALGYYLPHGNGTHPYEGKTWWKKPNFNPDGFLPNAYQVRWDHGLLWVTERGTGLYALRYTGPVPGPV
ncbi:MAG: hypothetical protein LC623_04020 [Halobacteriales archaeon]|nr:hypothetical protein [Halobacteriales archaeon]